MPTDDELRSLQERAYGPRADIHDDREALERLRALEQPLVEQEPDVLPPIAPDPASTPLPSPAASSMAPAVIRPTPARPARLPVATAVRWVLSSRRRVLVTMWAATLAVALVVAGVAIALVQRLQAAPLVPDAMQVARLAVEPAADVPDQFDGGVSAAVGFDDYLDLKVVMMGFTTETGDRCLSVYDTESITFTDSGYGTSRSSGFWQGCGAGAVPPSVQFLVTQATFPETLRENPGVGTTVQFVYDVATNEVVVFEMREQKSGI